MRVQDFVFYVCWRQFCVVLFDEVWGVMRVWVCGGVLIRYKF